MYDPNMFLHFERNHFESESANFSLNFEMKHEFLLSNVLPPSISEVQVSYSNNFCLHLFGFFSPMQKSKFDYYPKSGVYHLQNYGFRFEKIDDLLKVIEHKNLAGMASFTNDFAGLTEDNIYFLIFCPFKNQDTDSYFSANINFNFDSSLNGRCHIFCNSLASKLLGQDPFEAINSLKDSSQFNKTIFHQTYDLKNVSQVFQKNSFFKSSEKIIELIEIQVISGKLVVELDQKLKLGFILNESLDFEVSKDARYLIKHSDSPGKLKYMIGSSNKSFSTFLVLFRPDSLINQEVVLTIDYHRDSDTLDDEIVYINLNEESIDSDSENDKTNITMYSLIGLGILIIIICIIFAICFVYKRKSKSAKKNEEKKNQPKDLNPSIQIVAPNKRNSLKITPSKNSNQTGSSSHYFPNAINFERIQT